MSLLVALIIGTGDELEDEIAYQLGKKSICVLFCSNNENKFERIIKKLNNEDIEPKFIILNTVDLKTTDEVIEKIDEQFGKLDILINVGIFLDNNQFKINTMLYEGFESRESFDLLTVLKAFIRLLQKSPSSRIINVYGEMNEYDSDMKSWTKLFRDYSAKFELDKLMDQFYEEFTNTNIKISSAILGNDNNIQTIVEEVYRIVHLAILPFNSSPKSKTMRILYGIVGEGMGRATRSKVTLEILLKEQHHVKVVVSNRAYKFLHDNFSKRFPSCDEASESEAAIDIIKIEGLTMQYVNNVFDEKASVLHTMQRMPDMLNKNLDAYYKNLVSWMPQAVISDFDSFAYIFAKIHGLPILSIDNQHIVQRYVIPEEARESNPIAFYTYKCFVKAKLPRCNTIAVPPILRQSILDAKPLPVEHCEYFLVYQSSKSDTSLISVLQAFGEKCI
ncbi:unnamed protein product, partial [Rotaria sp. Silwood2]